MVFKVFQCYGVWDTSGSWLSILSFSGGPVLSQGQQSLGYGTATQVGSEWAEDFVVPALKISTGLPHPLAHPALARLSCAICSLYAWSDSSAGLPGLPQLKGEKSRENMETASQGKLGDILQCWGWLPAVLRPSCSLQNSDNLCLHSPWFFIRDG